MFVTELAVMTQKPKRGNNLLKLFDILFVNRAEEISSKKLIKNILKSTGYIFSKTYKIKLN